MTKNCGKQIAIITAIIFLEQQFILLPSSYLQQRHLKLSRCDFMVEDDHPKAYKRYVSLAFKNNSIAFNKNGRPRTAKRVPNREHRSVLFLERRLYTKTTGFPMRSRRHGQRTVQDPCNEQNKLLLSRDWLEFWKNYCTKRKQRSLLNRKVSDR